MKWSLLLLLGLVALAHVRAEVEELDNEDLLEELLDLELDESEEELLRQFEEKNLVSCDLFVYLLVLISYLFFCTEQRCRT